MTTLRHPACLILVAMLAAGASARAQVPQVVERVEVSRIVVDLHVLADDGRPVRGLTAADLRVTVDGKPVKIDALRWITGSVALGDAPGATPPAPAGAPGTPHGRLLLFLFQKDLERSRIEGLMPMLRRAEGLVAALDPADRVAVASFDSHLELWSDFTTDRAAVSAILTRSILFAGRAGALVGGDPPLLSSVFDREAGRRAASMEQALLVIGRALDAVPGPKAVVLVGHGFGRIAGGSLQSSAVSFEADYAEARRLLTRARATVYCLDVTRADAHTLETGLMSVAEDTGGFFVRTHWFPGQAVSRLAEALSGHYELSFEKPDLPRGEHAIRVELVGRKGVVFARRTYVG